jgi:hypothetical protein
LSHDTPNNSEQPIANAASNSSVAPLKPNARLSAPPIESPNAPPGASGSTAGSFHRRIASIAALDNSTNANPSAASPSGCSRTRSGSAIRRKPATRSMTPPATHHHAERPNRYSSRSESHAPTTPPRLAIVSLVPVNEKPRSLFVYVERIRAM